MKIPGDVLKARKIRKELDKNPEVAALIKECDKHKRWWYDRVQAPEGRHLISLHNHSDAMDYTLDQIAITGARRGYKILAVTDHNRDDKFEGRRVIYFPIGEGIYLIRGCEVTCYEDGQQQGNFSAIGYEDRIASFCSYWDAMEQCIDQDGFNVITSPHNKFIGRGLGEYIHDAVEFLRAHGHPAVVEILNSASNLNVMTYVDALARIDVEKEGATGIFDEDAHILPEIGCAGFSLPKEALPVLSFRDASDYPAEIVGELRTALGKPELVENHGNYIPALSVIHPDKLISMRHKGCILKPGNLD